MDKFQKTTTVISLAVQIVGLIVIAWYFNSIDNRMKERTEARDNLSDRRRATIEMLDGILELKTFALETPSILQSLAEDGRIQKMIKNNIAKNPAEIVTNCKLFFHLEKIYSTSHKGGFTDREIFGINTEITMWLKVPALQKFFYDFCNAQACYSPDFLKAVDNFYKGELK
jgi:hypothetical protein